MAHGAPKSRHSTLLMVLVAAVAAVAATFAFGCGSNADKYVGYWSLAGQGQGAEQSFALHITRSGDQYLVDIGGSELGRAKLSGGKLEVTLPTQVFELTRQGDQLQLTTHGAWEPGLGMQPLTLHRIDATQFVAAREGWMNRVNDAAVREGIHSIQIGIQTWAVDHNDTFPPARVVARSLAIGTYYVDKWPTNPFTNQPMHAGTGPGDYQYTSNGKTYKLIGLSSDGKPVITVP